MSKVASRQPILISASWYFLEKAIRLIGAFLIGAWVARYLGPESYGALAYALALVAVLGFLGSLGIESLVVRDLVEAKRDQCSILSTYFFIRLAGSRIFALLIWSAVPVFVGIATSQVIVNERTYWVSLLRTLVGMTSSLILIFPAITYYGTAGAAGVVIISACINAALILASGRSRRVIFSVLTNRPVHPAKP